MIIIKSIIKDALYNWWTIRGVVREDGARLMSAISLRHEDDSAADMTTINYWPKTNRRRPRASGQRPTGRVASELATWPFPSVVWSRLYLWLTALSAASRAPLSPIPRSWKFDEVTLTNEVLPQSHTCRVHTKIPARVVMDDASLADYVGDYLKVV